MMEDVCKSGTGRNGYVAGYRIAGKTGTTQKYQLAGTYIASFACFAPADNPEIALLLIVDEPASEMNGSTVCAPWAAKIMESSLEYLGVERQYTDKEQSQLDTVTPGVIGQNAADAVQTLEKKGFTVRVIGSGNNVISQSPAGGQTIPQGGVIALYTTDNEEEKLDVTVPDLSGMSVKSVKKYAASEGLNVRISGNSGSGVISYEQSIEPGTTTEYGTIITVYFKSYENIGDSTED
jgi:stage V sporulation protein D (sporulation-specific penicillin-binding protein)